VSIELRQKRKKECKRTTDWR